MVKFINYAHRGAPAYYPENTMLSFKAGVEMGANGIETDVQVSKDGVLVLFHDDTLDRVTGASGAIKDYTYNELSKIRVKHNGLEDKVPTFEEFLNYFKDFDLTFAIELKVGGVETAVADMIFKVGVQDKVIITSFNFDYISNIKKYAPSLRVGYLTYGMDNSVNENLKNIGGYEICPNAKQISNKDVDKWHELGFNVRAWNIENEAVMINAVNIGVDGMTVNFPDKLTSYMKLKV